MEGGKTTTFPVTVEVYNRRVQNICFTTASLTTAGFMDSFKIVKCINKCSRSMQYVIRWPARLKTLKNIETDEVTIKTLHIYKYNSIYT